MKKNVLGLLPFIIFLFGVISCEEPEDVVGSGEGDAPIYFQFQVNIENNTDSQIDVKVMSVMFGKTDYNENIYIDEKSYNEHFFSNVRPQYSSYAEMLLSTGWKEYISGSNIYVDNDVTADTNQYINEKINAKNKSEKMNFRIYGSWKESMLIEIKFANGEVCYLAGWPEYYNDVIKLENVKKFGFAYDVPIDKKIDSYIKNGQSKYKELFFFDEQGNIDGEYIYGSCFYYPMNITINSVDDIQLEISELTEVEPDENGNEITE
jgi:hypothetical protein